MVLFLPFNSGVFENTSPASGPSKGQGLPAGVWPKSGDAHPNDPPPVELFPMGRPPLTPEQTRRSYARQLGVDPSQIDINGMRLNLDGAAALADAGNMSPGNETHPTGKELAIAHEVQPRYTSTATASDGQAEENGGVLSDSYPPARESQRGQQNGAQTDPGEEGKEKEPKEEPSPDGTTLLTVTGAAIWHSALYIKGKNFLYDPGGSFFLYGGRPRDAIFDVDESGLRAYVAFHRKNEEEVEMTPIHTTPSQENLIVSRANILSDPGGGRCAWAVSSALRGICGIEISYTPSGLRSEVEGAKCGQ